MSTLDFLITFYGRTTASANPHMLDTTRSNRDFCSWDRIKNHGSSNNPGHLSSVDSSVITVAAISADPGVVGQWYAQALIVDI